MNYYQAFEIIGEDVLEEHALNERQTMTTYRIIRKYFDCNHPGHDKVLYTGVPLLQAQRHCKMQHTRLENVWFDCYEAEPKRFDKYGDPIVYEDYSDEN